MIQEIEIKKIKVVENHRTNIQESGIDEMMISIKQHGIKQPIGLMENNDEGDQPYTLVFGQRRLMAAEKLGWTKVPAIVDRNFDDQKFMVLNLTENLQRRDPSFVELGRGIEKLQKSGLTIKEISARLGIEVTKVTNILKAYTCLPEKHRDKVTYSSKGKRLDNSIPVQLATKLAKVKKDLGIDNKTVDKIIDYVAKTKMVKEDINSLVLIMKQGLTFEEAIDKMGDYGVYAISIIAKKSDISRAMNSNNIFSFGKVFQSIVYGKIGPIKKPDFIK